MSRTQRDGLLFILLAAVGYAFFPIFTKLIYTDPALQPLDVLTGFLSKEGDAYGRPVGVAIDKRGALLAADDVGNVIWRVTAAD